MWIIFTVYHNNLYCIIIVISLVQSNKIKFTFYRNMYHSCTCESIKWKMDRQSNALLRSCLKAVVVVINHICLSWPLILANVDVFVFNELSWKLFNHNNNFWFQDIVEENDTDKYQILFTKQYCFFSSKMAYIHHIKKIV